MSDARQLRERLAYGNTNTDTNGLLIRPGLRVLSVTPRPEVEVTPQQKLNVEADLRFATSQVAPQPVFPGVGLMEDYSPSDEYMPSDEYLAPDTQQILRPQQEAPRQVVKKFRRQPLKLGQPTLANQKKQVIPEQYTADGTAQRAGEPLNEKVQAQLTLEAQLRSRQFLAILIFAIFGAVIFWLNAFSNQEVVDIENEFSSGLSLGWFLVISFVLAIVVAHMVYKPYVIETSMGRNSVLIAFILYIIAQMFWSLVLFHTRINRGTAGLASILWLSATIWLGWTCYHYCPESIYPLILLLLWIFYIMDYTYNVDAKPWRSVPLGGGRLSEDPFTDIIPN